MTQAASATWRHSLKGRLVRWLVILQAALLSLLVLLVVFTLCVSGHLVPEHDEDRVIDTLRAAVIVDAQGRLALRATPELSALRAEIGDLWYVIRDNHGHALTGGAVPEDYARIGDSLSHISQARLGWLLGDPPRSAARLKRVESAAGPVQILAPTQGRMTGGKAMVAGALVFLGLALPALALMTVATLFATPIVVRRALASLDDAAAQAQHIDIDRRGTRLPIDAVPTEVRPLISAVNDALGRLDDGYERHHRFLADAAHELRTPIAILNTRLESLPHSPENARLLQDVARLSVLAEQLLDLQRVNQRLSPFLRVDLVAVGRRVATDLAPMAIAAGYDVAFEPECSQLFVTGDQISLERALTNLVQNAIEHGGRRGKIAIRVDRNGAIEVTDEGPGIPLAQRGRIFEPFYRLRPHERGAGLGLNLVREIVRLHNGSVSVTDAPGIGACFRMEFPILPLVDGTSDEAKGAEDRVSALHH